MIFRRTAVTSVMFALLIMLAGIYSPQKAYSLVTCADGSTAPIEEECIGGATGNQTPAVENLPGFAEAERIDVRECSVDDGDYVDNILGIPVWYKYMDVKKDVFVFSDGSESDGKCTPRLERNADGSIDPASALPIGLAVLEIMMTLAGIVAVVMVFWGAFKFLVSQGEPDKAAGARKTVINAAIGLVIIIVATRVVSFIANTLTSPPS